MLHKCDLVSKSNLSIILDTLVYLNLPLRVQIVVYAHKCELSNKWGSLVHKCNSACSFMDRAVVGIPKLHTSLHL